MGENVTVQFQIQYHGTKGDENFDLYLFGKKFTFRNIGTAQQTLVRRVTGRMSDLRVVFHNAGTGNDQRCWYENHQRCRRRRRWGRRRTRCSGNPRVHKCRGGAWSRNVVIKSIKLNGSSNVMVDVSKSILSVVIEESSSVPVSCKIPPPIILTSPVAS